MVPRGSRGRGYLLVDPAAPDTPRPLGAQEAAALAGEAFTFYAPFPDRP